MIVPFSHVLILSAILFVMGMVCSLARRNFIMILIGLEIMLNAVLIAFVGASLYFHHLEGQVFVLFIIAIAAAEVSVGLSLFVAVYRQTGNLEPRLMRK
jgi:NADH-quinone oxidoreductase subunit K